MKLLIRSDTSVHKAEYRETRNEDLGWTCWNPQRDRGARARPVEGGGAASLPSQHKYFKM